MDAADLCAEYASSAEELAMFRMMLGLDDTPVRLGPRGRYGRQGCGTRAGYQRHKDRGQTVCDACDEANSTYMRDYQRTRYTPERRRLKYEWDKARGYYDRRAS